jgi:hypothetical protein
LRNATATNCQAGLDVGNWIADAASTGLVDGSPHGIIAVVPSPFAQQAAGVLLVLAAADEVVKAGAEGDFGLIDWRGSARIFRYGRKNEE